MTVARFFNEIMDEKNYDFDELANLLNLNYSTMKTLIYRSNNLLSVNMVNKFSKALKEKPEMLFYKTIADRAISRVCSDGALYLICQKYCQGSGVDIDLNLDGYRFCGSYYKKRSFNSYTLVDDWNMLEVEYWNSHFKNVNPLWFSDMIYKSIFLSEKAYISSVLYYGIQKAESISSFNVVNYSIICNNKKLIHDIKHCLPKKSAINITLIDNTVPTELLFNNYVITDDNDETYINSLHRFAIKSELFSESEKVPKYLWVCVLQAVLACKNYLNYDYAFNKIVVKDDYCSLLSEEERMELSLNNRFGLYVERKIKSLKGEESQRYELNKRFSNLTTVIVNAVSFGHMNLNAFKELLRVLKPYINYYEKNSNEKIDLPILY